MGLSRSNIINKFSFVTLYGLQNVFITCNSFPSREKNSCNRPAILISTCCEHTSLEELLTSGLTVLGLVCFSHSSDNSFLHRCHRPVPMALSQKNQAVLMSDRYQAFLPYPKEARLLYPKALGEWVTFFRTRFDHFFMMHVYLFVGIRKHCDTVR